MVWGLGEGVLRRNVWREIIVWQTQKKAWSNESLGMIRRLVLHSVHKCLLSTFSVPGTMWEGYNGKQKSSWLHGTDLLALSKKQNVNHICNLKVSNSQILKKTSEININVFCVTQYIQNIPTYKVKILVKYLYSFFFFVMSLKFNVCVLHCPISQDWLHFKGSVDPCGQWIAALESAVSVIKITN